MGSDRQSRVGDRLPVQSRSSANDFARTLGAGVTHACVTSGVPQAALPPPEWIAGPLPYYIGKNEYRDSPRRIVIVALSDGGAANKEQGDDG